MAVKIRLTRRGRKKKATYDVIVADARSPRDGRLIEKLGTYNPLTNPATINIDEEKALDWLLKGAQPTDTTRRILSHKGLMLKKHLQIGVNKGAITQEQADKKFDEWVENKEAVINKNVDAIEKKKADEAKARLDAEKKVNEAKAEALRQKLAVVEPQAEVEEEAPAAEATEVPAEEVKAEEAAPAVEEAKAEETAPVVEEAKAEEAAPVAEEAKVEEAAPIAEEAKAKEAPAKEAKEEAPADAPVAEAKEEAAPEKAVEEKKEEK